MALPDPIDPPVPDDPAVPWLDVVGVVSELQPRTAMVRIAIGASQRWVMVTSLSSMGIGLLHRSE
jgi:hypothetical protein